MLRLRIPLSIVFPVLAALLLAAAGFAQTGFTKGLPCNDPVAVSQITGTWSDSVAGTTWTLRSDDTLAVTGTVTAPGPAGGCTGTWQIQGSVGPGTQVDNSPGYSFLNETAKSPVIQGDCNGWVPSPTVTGTWDVVDVTNNKGTGTVVGYVSASSTISKPADMPTGETTLAVGFGTGFNATVGQFRPTLIPANSILAPGYYNQIFQGRQVIETTAQEGFGSCWEMGSPSQHYVSVTGSIWNVGYYSGLDNTYVDDYIAWNTTTVAWYQQNTLIDGVLQCSSTIYQGMNILISGTGAGQVRYTTHTIKSTVAPGGETVCKDTVCQFAKLVKCIMNCEVKISQGKGDVNE